MGDAVANIITHNVKSVLPIAPSEISASKDPLAKLADTLTPSLFKAQIEWLMDRSAFGATIKPNNVQRDKLLLQQSRQKTAEFWKETAEMMYEQFGIDAHPEMYKRQQRQVQSTHMRAGRNRWQVYLTSADILAQ